jgi:U3 small nucleolar RNA-associated protein 7
MKSAQGKKQSALKAAYSATVIGKKELQKYAHGPVEFKTKRAKTLALKTRIDHTNENIEEAAVAAIANEVLLPSNPGFIELENQNMKVYKLKQSEIAENVDLNSARNAFDLQLHSFAPYCVKYSRNGR